MPTTMSTSATAFAAACAAASSSPRSRTRAGAPRCARRLRISRSSRQRAWTTRKTNATRAAANADDDDAGGGGGGGGSSAPPSASDALAERLAKAKAYRDAVNKQSASMGKPSEMADAVKEAIARAERAKASANDDASSPTPSGPKEVKVKILTRNADYNPFGEDEAVVGRESETGEVFRPEAGGAFRGDGPTAAQAEMLRSGGRRRERGLGSEEANADPVEARPKLEISKPPGEGEDAENGESNYKPSVSTWGVFPRPDNISEAYGGGKTIKAGEFVPETEEEKEARRKRVRDKLKQFRSNAGIEVSNGTIVRWQAALTEAKSLMSQGKLQASYELLEPIVKVENISPKLEIGGDMIFNYAVCLDSCGRREEALEMYKRCVGCPHGKVSKMADRMIWGMTTASKKMKADQFDYDGIKDKYDPFLIKMTTERQDWKIESDPEEEEALKKVTAASVAFVVALPLAMGALIYASRF